MNNRCLDAIYRLMVNKRKRNTQLYEACPVLSCPILTRSLSLFLRFPFSHNNSTMNNKINLEQKKSESVRKKEYLLFWWVAIHLLPTLILSTASSTLMPA